VAVEHLKFIDESGCHLGLTRAYGWAKRSEKCHYRVPGNTGERKSMVALFSLAGMEVHRLQAGSLKGEHFASFIEEAVLPCLRAGDVVVVDNARCHYAKRARELIEGVGAALVFLPAYSPDYAPIELAWRTVKSVLRQVEARTPAALADAVTEAIASVTGEEARRFFAHCGYHQLQTL
jgi:transposase